MAIDAVTAWIFLPFVLPVAVVIAACDLGAMRIPNVAVIAVALIFVLLGPLALPLSDYLLRLVQGAGALAVLFLLWQGGAMGAGDAKYAAALALYVDPADATVALALLAAALLAAFATHRAARAIPAVRRAVPTWKSWHNPKFPAGLALSGAVLAYLVAGALSGA